MTEPPGELLIEADLFISYLTADRFVEKFDLLIEAARTGTSALFASSEVFDNVISALRSKGRTLRQVGEFVGDMKAIPFECLPLTVNEAAKAIELYDSHGGRSRLHYFDAFHVATAIHHKLALATSDLYITRNAYKLGLEAVNIRQLDQIMSHS